MLVVVLALLILHVARHAQDAPPPRCRACRRGAQPAAEGAEPVDGAQPAAGGCATCCRVVPSLAEGAAWSRGAAGAASLSGGLAGAAS